MSHTQEKLFKNFTETDKNTWIEKAIEKLKDKNIQALQSSTYEGITLDPFYTSENAVETSLQVHDFTQNWKTRQKVVINHTNEGIEKINALANKGIEELQFDIQNITEDLDLETLIKTAQEHNFSVILEINANFANDLENLASLKFEGAIYYDFLANWTITGDLQELYFTQLAELIDIESQNKVCALCINTQNFQNAGANVVQELAFGLAMAVEYLDRLTEKGLDKNLLFRNTVFSMAIGSNYFMEIAKFRVLRVLWNMIEKAYEVEKTALTIHAETSQWNKSVLDKYNNMLRSTTEAMSAVIGGVNSLTVQPFDTVSKTNDDFSERIARNVSLLLKEEAHLNKIIDASKGSFYIEKLTQELAEKAWHLFQTIEEKGGFIKAFEAGFIQDEIEKIAKLRQENFNSETDTLVGVNKYPNSMEEKPAVPLPSKPVEANIPLLKLQRLAEVLEK